MLSSYAKGQYILDIIYVEFKDRTPHYTQNGQYYVISTIGEILCWGAN